ncbi:MAG: Wzz/FepE/Etk N-terminal domain-containing protein [Candidatus Cloacimonetes bacterium]|nr:Wzz/FepE/Etk N-terminal domain-containing protein [Candidatus Cloacimonadota bacterium]
MNNDLGILDLALLIAKNKKLVIWLTVIAAISSITYSLIVPKHWKSTATIVPVSEGNDVGAFSTNLLDLAGGSLFTTSKAEQAIDFITIMKSRTFSQKVVDEFKLIKYFKITSEDSLEAREVAVRSLTTKVLKASYDEESQVVRISAETRSKTLSRDIVQYYIDNLAKYNLSNRMSKGKQKREFLQLQVNKHMREADSLGLAIRDFQVKNRSIALDKQTEAMVSLYGEQSAEYIKAEIEYDLARTQYAENSPTLLTLAEKKKVLSQKLKEIESSDSKLVPRYVMQIDRIPDLSMQYAQMMINVEIKKKVIEYLYPQFELAKLEELKDLPTFEVLDPPQLAGLRSKPKRAITVILSTFAAFMIACCLALIKERLFVQNSDKIQEIIRTVFARK